jgi:hypothetical protein
MTRCVAIGLEVASSDVPTSPRQKDPSRLGDDFCAICASIGLAGALVVPAAPGVPPEIASFKELRWSLAATQLCRSAVFISAPAARPVPDAPA